MSTVTIVNLRDTRPMVSLLLLFSVLPGRSAPVLPTYADTFEHGFVFVDGQYYPAPYILVELDSQVFVNGTPLPLPRRHADGRADPAAIGIVLRTGGIVVANSDAPYVAIRTGSEINRFLRQVSSSDPNVRALAADLLQGRPQKWSSWLESIEPGEDFTRRAHRHLARMRSIREETEASRTGRQTNASMAYPLTILGMFAAIWSFGHLIGSAPGTGLVDPREAANPQIARATTLSILAVGILSTFDLIWTLMASQAGLMHELNPIGSRLLGSPTVLVGFKLIATAIGCGLLFAFRKDHRGRKAAWWMCMVLTLLTFRWLIFGSMHLAV